MCYKINLACIVGSIVVFMAFNVLSLITIAEDPVTIQDILEGIRQNESQIKSGKGILIVKQNVTEAGKQDWLQHTQRSKEYENPMVWESLVIDSDNVVSYSFKGEKFRFDIRTVNKIWDGKSDQEYRTVINRAYDGQTLTEQRITLNGISGLIETDPIKGIVAPDLDPRDWGIYSHYMGKSLSDALKMMEPELVGTEVIDGNLCYIIRPKPLPYPNLPPEVIEAQKKGGIWIDPQKGYSILKIESVGIKSKSLTTIQHKKLAKDIWVPYLERSKSFLIDPDTGKEVIGRELTRELKDFQVNIDIPDDMFTIIFEKGADVFDARTGRSFVIE